MIPEIGRVDVRRFMSWELPEGSELYERIVDSLVDEPEGQVAQWCDEVRIELRGKYDSLL